MGATFSQRRARHLLASVSFTRAASRRSLAAVCGVCRGRLATSKSYTNAHLRTLSLRVHAQVVHRQRSSSWPRMRFTGGAWTRKQTRAGGERVTCVCAWRVSSPHSSRRRTGVGESERWEEEEEDHTPVHLCITLGRAGTNAQKMLHFNIALLGRGCAV